MSAQKKYYQNPEELNPESSLKKKEEVQDENQKAEILELFDGSLKGNASRRDFLKLAGFSAVLSTVISSCEKPIQKAIPYLIKPEEITPGKADYYATTFFDGDEYCNLLVKSRDGRPIKIEGNPKSPLTQGGTSARVQASVLSLYDDDRFKSPLYKGNKISWDEADKAIMPKLKSIAGSKGAIVLLTSTIISPAANSIIRKFQDTFPGAKHIQYDAVSCSAMLLANEKNFGVKQLPSYYFDKADVVVSFDADFLGTWISPVEYTAQYVSRRKLKDNKGNISRHIQFEAGMSLTGTNADERYPMKPSEETTILAGLYNEIAGKTGLELLNVPSAPGYLVNVANELLKAKGRSLVISGSNDINNQLLVNRINDLLGNYGSTVDIQKPVYLKQGVDSEMQNLVADMNNGRIAALLIWNTNPAYHYPDSKAFIDGLKKTSLVVTFAASHDETAALCEYVCPSNHYLESWGDAEPRDGFYSLQQPLIAPIFDTRQWEENLLRWTGDLTPMHDYLNKFWETDIFPLQKEKNTFYDFWVTSMQTGIFETSSEQPKTAKFAPPSDLTGIIKPSLSQGTEIHLYQPVAITNGRHANNPWLQEMPDPVTKAVWENYASLSPKFAADHGLEEFDVIIINDNYKLPVLIQPGQAYDTISVGLGYGRKDTGKIADGMGINVYPLALVNGGFVLFSGAKINFKKAGYKYTIARSQIHSSPEGRPIIHETTLDKYRKDSKAGNEVHFEVEKNSVSLYKKPFFDGFQWGMSVDLNSCTGCGACLIACQAENNVPVIGKTQVMKDRIMHWIRIDRYYTGNPEKPLVVHQPVMCMHCSQAPCENVCPVSATMHNNEGLNQVAYTRCVGTKYCINNCPYKVRKFNWFQYAENLKFNYNENSDLGRMVLNPDVTVRERGVVEKCSFCSQRIQEKKLQAKLENRILNGAEVQPACVQACPAKALVFGDLNNPENEVSQQKQNDRNYFLLEELHTLPSVGYLTKIRNRNA